MSPNRVRSPHRFLSWPRLALGIGCLTLAATTATPSAAGDCRAASGARALTVVELYTSEGCSSCPPADRWVSTVSRRDGVVTLAFHVDYWDRLGWRDRFAQAEFTRRQYALQAAAGAAFVYTPQVIVNGRDWRGWPGALPATDAATAPQVSLRRDGDTVTAQVAASAQGGRLSGYWAITENGHQSVVAAGENQGNTLHHDAVVRSYMPVAAWSASAAKTLTWTVPATADGAPVLDRRIIFVVTDDDQRPLQAVSLGC